MEASYVVHKREKAKRLRLTSCVLCFICHYVFSFFSAHHNFMFSLPVNFGFKKKPVHVCVCVCAFSSVGATLPSASVNKSDNNFSCSIMMNLLSAVRLRAQVQDKSQQKGHGWTHTHDKKEKITVVD